jgi:hypothetical protein
MTEGVEDLAEKEPLPSSQLEWHWNPFVEVILNKKNHHLLATRKYTHQTSRHTWLSVRDFTYSKKSKKFYAVMTVSAICHLASINPASCDDNGPSSRDSCWIWTQRQRRPCHFYASTHTFFALLLSYCYVHTWSDTTDSMVRLARDRWPAQTKRSQRTTPEIGWLYPNPNPSQFMSQV